MIPRNLRWLLAPIAAVSGCSGSLVLIDAIDRGVERVAGPASVEAVLATDIRAGVTYAVAAVLFVGAALIAPTHRSLTAIALYACGAVAAWKALRNWYFPEGHPFAYQPSIVPLVLTLIGGAIGLFAVMSYDQCRRNERCS